MIEATENKELLCIRISHKKYWVYTDIHKNEFMFKKWILEMYQNDKICSYISDN